MEAEFLTDKAFLATIGAIVTLLTLVVKTWGRETKSNGPPSPTTEATPVPDKLDALIKKMDAAIVAIDSIKTGVDRLAMHENERRIADRAVKDYKREQGRGS